MSRELSSLADETKTNITHTGVAVGVISDMQEFGGAVLLSLPIDHVEEQIAELRDTLARLEEKIDSIIDMPSPQLAAITTLGSPSYRLSQTVFAAIHAVAADGSDGDSDYTFVATVAEANVAASGETIDEAIDNLKDRLVGKLELLQRLPKLSEKLKQQRRILEGLISTCHGEAPHR